MGAHTDKCCDPSLLDVNIENVTLKHGIVNLKHQLETPKEDKAQSKFVRDEDVLWRLGNLTPGFDDRHIVIASG